MQLPKDIKPEKYSRWIAYTSESEPKLVAENKSGRKLFKMKELVEAKEAGKTLIVSFVPAKGTKYIL